MISCILHKITVKPYLLLIVAYADAYDDDHDADNDDDADDDNNAKEWGCWW